MQCFAVCIELHVCYSVLQCAEVQCNAEDLDRHACREPAGSLLAVCCSVLQCVAMRCSVMEGVADGHACRKPSVSVIQCDAV